MRLGEWGRYPPIRWFVKDTPLPFRIMNSKLSPPSEDEMSTSKTIALRLRKNAFLIAALLGCTVMLVVNIVRARWWSVGGSLAIYVFIGFANWLIVQKVNRDLEQIDQDADRDHLSRP